MTPATDRRRRCVMNFSPRARGPMALALAATAAVAMLVGCDDAGNARAMGVQADAAAAAAVGGVPSSATIDTLAEVAGRTDASPVVIESRSALGHAKLGVAQDESLNAATLQRQALQQLYHIAGVTNQARESATLATIYTQLDPKPAIDLLKSFASGLKGDGGAKTFATADDASLPTLAAVDEQKAKLEGDVAREESELADLKKQRDAKLTAAGEASARADREKGEARLAIVKEAAAARNEAAALASQIATKEMELARSRADLAVQDALKAQLAESIAGLEEQAEVVQAGWTEVAKKAGDLKTLAKDGLAGGDKLSAKSLAGDYAAQVKELDAARTKAETAYEEAVKAFASAAELAGTLSRDISSAKSANAQAFEAAAWDTQAAVLAADRFNLDKAMAELSLAGFRSETARFLAAQARVAAMLERTAKEAGATAPGDLPSRADAMNALAESVKAADADFDAALSSLEGVSLSGNDLAALKPQRDAMKVLGRYARAQLADLAGQAGVAPEIAGGKKKLIDDAREAAREARDNGTVLPRLPAEITPPPAPAAPADGAAPAAPTDGATPAAPPADGAATPPADGAAPAAAE